MEKNKDKKIVAVVDDLFFTVKIADAAKKAGLKIDFVKDEKAVLEAAGERPLLIIFDLNHTGTQPVSTIARLKGDRELRRIPLIGYVSHVQADLKMKAQEAGCDVVLARSAFSTNLPLILKRHAGAY